MQIEGFGPIPNHVQIADAILMLAAATWWTAGVHLWSKHGGSVPSVLECYRDLRAAILETPDKGEG